MQQDMRPGDGFSWNPPAEYFFEGTPYPCRPHKRKVLCSVIFPVLRLWFSSYAGDTGRSAEDLLQIAWPAQQKIHIPLASPLHGRDRTRSPVDKCIGQQITDSTQITAGAENGACCYAGIPCTSLNVHIHPLKFLIESRANLKLGTPVSPATNLGLL
jgi:hypothetical protein